MSIYQKENSVPRVTEKVVFRNYLLYVRVSLSYSLSFLLFIPNVRIGERKFTTTPAQGALRTVPVVYLVPGYQYQ
jgi:hypothetical protein